MDLPICTNQCSYITLPCNNLLLPYTYNPLFWGCEHCSPTKDTKSRLGKNVTRCAQKNLVVTSMFWLQVRVFGSSWLSINMECYSGRARSMPTGIVEKFEGRLTNIIVFSIFPILLFDHLFVPKVPSPRRFQ